MRPFLKLASASILTLAFSSCTTKPDISVAKSEALWSGTWKSDQHVGAHGLLSAAFPKKPPIDTAFKVKAKITHSPLSLYRPGHISTGTFEALISKDHELIGSNVENPIPSELSGGFVVKLKGNINNSDQIITYLGDLSPQLTSMKGEFESDSPSNQGTFYIQKISKK